MAHKVVVRETQEGYFVDRGTAEPMEFGNVDGEIRALPRKYVYDGTTGIGYFTREKAIEVALDWVAPVEVVVEECSKALPIIPLNTLDGGMLDMSNGTAVAMIVPINQAIAVGECDALLIRLQCRPDQ